MDLLIADDVIFRRAKRVELAAQYNVSLSAVREALARLAAEGLLDWEDHRGYRVASISADDLIDLTQTRIDLESLALRRAIARGDDTWKKKVSDALTALLEYEKETHRNDQRRHSLHADYHGALFEPCGSLWLLRLGGMLFERAERYRLPSPNYSKMRGEVDKRHVHRAAVEERNADKACKILVRHIRATTKTLLDVAPSSKVARELRTNKKKRAAKALPSLVR
ncbi:GntR family transcriptional regulator [Bradyrhizobium diversitatis]|uniref:GntR family transcriptional regulator n=1 Tax=Bradyrhizobium diversitatis TaxID=2755406 RepID=A0ABS0NUU0_9BRAD|nr:GntR family transcriptional regulator [Bradyrhizobium diversitatis]MBH5384766.1 GntR family transcriptional regulator [Bradyrhizobium diversitatis]